MNQACFINFNRKEIMQFNFVLRISTIAWIIESGLCQSGVCSRKRGKIVCCLDYIKIDGACILCPEGYHGLKCKIPCPNGLYGAACKKECTCDEEQTCDPMRGCVFNFTEINVSTTTEIYFTATQEIMTKNANKTGAFPWQYLYLTPGSVIFFLIAVCLLVRHRGKRTEQNENAVDSVNDVPAVGIDPEDVPAPIVPRQPNSQQGATGSDYAEIRECVSVYAHSHDVTSVYNVLSFSRNKTIKQTQGSIQAIYGTSQLPALGNEAVVNPEISSQ